REGARPADGCAAQHDVRVPAAENACEQGRENDRQAADARRQQPSAVLYVAARPEPVQQRDRPACVGEPVDQTPARIADPLAQQARDHDGKQQVEGHRAETQPERTVGAREWDERIAERYRREAIEHRCEDVPDEEDHREQRHVAVQRVHQEARPPLRAPALDVRHAEGDRDRQEHERHGARGARHIPVGARSRSGELAHGQLPTGGTLPSESTRRAGSPSSASQSGAAPRRTSAAVVAMFASVQSAAATLTVRQLARTGAPVPGSMMWCIVAPARCQRRTAVLEVARPPERIETVWPATERSLRWSSVTRTCQPARGAGPHVATSPPRLTSAPQPLASAATRAARSAAHALAVAPRSMRTPGGTRTEQLARSMVTLRQPLRARARTARSV